MTKINHQQKYSHNIKFYIEDSCLYVKAGMSCCNSWIFFTWIWVICYIFRKKIFILSEIKLQQLHKHTKNLRVGNSSKNCIYLVSLR